MFHIQTLCVIVLVPHSAMLICLVILYTQFQRVAFHLTPSGDHSSCGNTCLFVSLFWWTNLIRISEIEFRLLFILVTLKMPQ